MEGVLPEPRHFTPIIRAEALGGAVENATALIHEMASSTLGKQLGPSVDSFNALLEARPHRLGLLRGGSGLGLRDRAMIRVQSGPGRTQRPAGGAPSHCRTASCAP